MNVVLSFFLHSKLNVYVYLVSKYLLKHPKIRKSMLECPGYPSPCNPKGSSNDFRSFPSKIISAIHGKFYYFPYLFSPFAGFLFARESPHGRREPRSIPATQTYTLTNLWVYILNLQNEKVFKIISSILEHD